MMGLSLQVVLAWAGGVALMGAAVSFGLAMRTYVHQDIRAVRADLSGRRRAEEVDPCPREALRAPGRPVVPGPRASPLPAGEAQVSEPAIHGADHEASGNSFRVTRRILLVSSEEVIGEA